MSTPNEGPERAGLAPWTPGDTAGAAQALSQLGPREQQALGRVIKVAAAVGPMIDAVAKCIRGIRNTMSRLSQLAQRLYSSGVNRAEQGLNSGRQQAEALKDRASNKAGELSQQGKDAVTAARETGANVKDWVVETGANLGKGAVNLSKAAVAGGKDLAGAAVAGSKELAGKAGRWFNQTVSRGAAKASAALAGLAVRRSDPTLTSPDQNLQKRDVLLAQKAAELFTSPESQRPAKAAELAAFIQSAYGNEQKVSLEKSGGPEQSVEAGARTSAATHEMAWVLKGQTPASQMPAPSTPDPAASASGEQTGQHAKKEGPNQSGPQIG